MAEILCVYRQVAMLRCQAECGESQGQDSGGGSLAIVSYDEKPGIQAIGTTAPDRPPLPGVSPTVMRHIRVTSKHELRERLLAFISDINREPVVHTWHYKIDNAA